MTVHDLVIANASGSAVRTDLNSALAAIGSNSSNSSAVTGSNSYPYQWQVRTDVNKLYMRDGSTNTTWHEVGDVGVANLGLAKLASPTFTGVVEIANGTNSAPSIAFDSDTDTGIYRSTSNVLGISASGTASHLFKSDGSEPQVPLKATNGTAAAPSLSFASDVNTGLFRANSDRIGVTCGGTHVAEFLSNQLELRNNAGLRLNDSANGNYVQLKANSNTAADYDLIFPNNSGASNQILKSDGSGNLVWTTVSSLQTSGNVKGFIAFNGGNGSQIRANGLTVSRTGTGQYTVTINSDLRIGNANYGVIIGNIDESGSHSFNAWTTGNGSDPNNAGLTDNFRVAFVESRSTNSFNINAYSFDSSVVYPSSDDGDRGFSYRRIAVDPAYICVAFLT